MSLTSCNVSHEIPSRRPLRSTIARVAAWLAVGAVCVTATVTGTTAGLLYVSGIFQ